MTMHRREFLKRVAAGGALAAAPALLPGCATQEPVVVVDTPQLDNPFVSWFGLDDASIARLMSTLTSNGGDFADAFFEVATSNYIAWLNGEMADSGGESRQGTCLRVVRGAETDFVVSEDLRLQSLLAAARATAKGSAEPAPWSPTFVEPGDLYPVVTAWTDVADADKLELLRSVETRVRASEASVETVTLRWDDTQQVVMIATADGRIATDVRPLARLSLVVTATRGDARQTGFSSLAVRAGLEHFTGERLDTLVAEAVGRTLVQFEARRAPAGDLPVIVSAGAGGVLLHEAVGHALEADLVASGPYGDRIGEKVAESLVTLVDDARMPLESGALNVDDEGADTQRNVLVENGKLKSLLYDRRTAGMAGVAATGSARRESYRHLPLPRQTCTRLENGPHTRDEIIATIDRGVICDSFHAGSVQPGPGEFRFSVKNGWIVEKGRIVAPTKDFEIVGNGPDLLANITMVADDFRMDAAGWRCSKGGQTVPGSHGMPTVLVSSLVVR